MKKSPMPSTESLLIERGVLNLPSARQRQVLGCIACRLNNARNSGGKIDIYSAQIERCSGAKAGTISGILRRLKEGGVLMSEREDEATANRRTPRRQYKPTRTALGTDFVASLEAPPTCGLEKEKSSPADATPEAPAVPGTPEEPKSGVEQAIEIVGTIGSEEELRIIATAVRKRSEELKIEARRQRWEEYPL